MMEVHYARRGGVRPPPDEEQLTIRSDGSFTLWRSVSWATIPPTPVGYFGGQLDKTISEALETAVSQAVAAGDLQTTLRSDEVPETITIGEINAKLGIHQEPDGAWGALVKLLRGLLLTLTEFPKCAIALEITSDGQNAQLIQHGSEAFEVDLRHLTVEAILRQGGEQVGSWKDSPKLAKKIIKVGPNWSLTIPLKHQFKFEPDQEMAVYANFRVIDEGFPVDVSLLTYYKIN